VRTVDAAFAQGERYRLQTIDELYEELLHYWFDPDSPMSKEEGFIPGPGRPPGA
jgi:hypothetical protein